MARLTVIISTLCSVTACRLMGGRPPHKMDHVLCKVQLFKQVDTLQESEDPRAFAEAYYNKSGLPCKTYCRIRSGRLEFGMRNHVFDSPSYIPCGIDRYCAKGGKCKRIGSPNEEENHNNKAKDAKPEGVTSSSASAPSAAPAPTAPTVAATTSSSATASTAANDNKAKDQKTEEPDER